MLAAINKYLDKLEAQGLAKREDSTFLAVDAELFSNKPIEHDVAGLHEIFRAMNVSSLLFASPSEPYRSIIRRIVEWDSECCAENIIVPMDCETRTFFHDFPVVDDLNPVAISHALSRRKAVIVRDLGIVTHGVYTPEQAYVSYSSACFSMFVKYFHDSLVYFDSCARNCTQIDADYAKAFIDIAQQSVVTLRRECVALRSGPPRTEDDVTAMLAEAGRAIVTQRLVDSHFGNISYVFKDHIFISQTGSSLDELEDSIDKVPLDGSSSTGITASSELSAHKNIYLKTGLNAIMHAHPKFSVIMSMFCRAEGCDRRLCHRICTRKREVGMTPIVPGEIGTGPTGLAATVPAVMEEGRGAIVYGHGVFAAERGTFQRPFDMLAQIEENCRQQYVIAVSDLLKHLLDSPFDGLAESG
ncbi:MAG TPA: class II aldolase/adducin family protein [Dissulfurispiraceae bacterium]|nr:class II aldolase/adducin family protein [Dissulfurispiraceae bacterium]